MAIPREPESASISALRLPPPPRSVPDSALTASIELAEELALAGSDERALGLLNTILDNSSLGQLSSTIERKLAFAGEQNTLSLAVRAATWTLYARSRENCSDFIDAIAAYRRAFALDANAVLLCRLSSLTYRVEGAYAAKKLLQDGIFRWPDVVAIRLLSAAFGIEADEEDRTSDLVRKALTADPTNVYASAAMARLALRFDLPDLAIDHARPVIALFPSLGRALLAIGMYRAGRIAEDPGLMNAVLADTPGDPWLLDKLAQAMLGLGQPAGALEMLDRAVSLAPRDRAINRTRGFSYMQLHRYEEAAFDFERAAEAGTDAWLIAMRGETARMLGDATGAVEFFQSIDADSQLDWVASSTGAALRMLNDLTGASAAFQRALTRDPDDIDALVGFSEVELDRGLDESFQLAERMLRRAVRVGAESAKAEALLAELLRRTGRPDEAIEHFDRALVLSPGYSYALGSKGQTLISVGRRQEGFDLLIQALRAAPETTWVLDELFAALSADTDEDYEQSDAILRRAERAIRDRNADRSPVLIRRARLARDHRQPADAVRFFRRACELGSAGPEYFVEFAGLLQDAGQQADALVVLDRELVRHPNHQGLTWKRIEILWDLNLLPTARDELERLMDQQEPPSAACAALGEIYRVEGRRGDARQLLERALRQIPDDAYAIASLGALDFDEGNIPAARQLLLRAKELRRDNGFATYMLIRLELEVGDVDNVSEVIGSVRNADPADREFALARMLALYGVGDYHGALDVAEQCLVAGGEDPSILRARGWVEIALARTRLARISFTAAAKMPDTAFSIIDAVTSLTRVDLWSTALTLAARSAGDGNPFASSALAVVWMRAGKWDKARIHAVAGELDAPDNSACARIAVRALRLSGEGVAALVHARAAILRWPGDQEIQNELAECLAGTAERDAADDAFERLLARLRRQAYRDADQFTNQGRCLLKLRSGKDAAQVLLRALSATDQTAAVLFDLVVASLLDSDVSQAAALEQRAGQELDQLSVPTRRGLMAAKTVDLTFVSGVLQGNARVEVDRLISDLQFRQQRLDVEFDLLLKNQGFITAP